MISGFIRLADLDPIQGHPSLGKTRRRPKRDVLRNQPRLLVMPLKLRLRSEVHGASNHVFPDRADSDVRSPPQDPGVLLHVVLVLVLARDVH